MAEWFGLFSSGPRCPGVPGHPCGVEVSPAEEAAYTRLAERGPVVLCEDCWAETFKGLKVRKSGLQVCRRVSRTSPGSRE